MTPREWGALRCPLFFFTVELGSAMRKKKAGDVVEYCGRCAYKPYCMRDDREACRKAHQVQADAQGSEGGEGEDGQ
jgi:hypothetical protein